MLGSVLNKVICTLSRIYNDIQGVYSPFFLGDIDEKTLNKISNTTKKYKTARKEKAGPMLNRTRRMLRNYFREPMKKLSSLLKDEKYTWADVYSGQD